MHSSVSNRSRASTVASSVQERAANLGDKFQDFLSTAYRRCYLDIVSGRFLDGGADEAMTGISYSFRTLIIQPINRWSLVFLTCQTLFFVLGVFYQTSWLKEVDPSSWAGGGTNAGGVGEGAEAEAGLGRAAQKPNIRAISQIPVWFQVLYVIFVALPASLYVALVANAFFLALIFSWLLRERILEQLGQLRLLAQLVATSDVGAGGGYGPGPVRNLQQAQSSIPIGWQQIQVLYL
eukprot:g15699.t1